MINDLDVTSQRQNPTMPRQVHRSTQRTHLGSFLSQTLLAMIPLLASLSVLYVGRPSQSAIRSLIVILFVCTFALFFRRLRADDVFTSLASTALILGFLFWYGYPALVGFVLSSNGADVNVPSYANDESIVKAIALLSLFLFSAITVITVDYKQNLRSSSAPRTQALSRTAITRLVRISVAACVLGLLPLVVLGGGLKNITRGIVESRAIEKAWLQTQNLGDSTSPFTFVASSALIAGVALLWLVLFDRRQPLILRLLVGAFAFAVSAVIYFDQGTRANLVLIFMPAVVMILTRAWKRSRLAAMAVILILVIAGILVLQFQTLYRTTRTRDRTSELLFQDWYTLGGTLDFFSETVFAVSIVPSSHDYFKESTVMLFLTSPIPRFIWTEKPISELVRFYILMRWNIDILTDAGNTFPGVVGQYYMSWGWFGPIIIGVIFGLIVSRLDRFLARELDLDAGYNVAAAIMVISWLVLCFRVFSPSYLYAVAFCVLIVWASRKADTKLKAPARPYREVKRWRSP